MDGYVLDARLTTLTAIGLVPEGARIDASFVGAITEGPLTGGIVEGVNYLLMRHDGSCNIDAREIITTPSGTGIAVSATGFVVPPPGLLSPEAVMDADFVWPDVDLALHGASRLATADPELRAANATMYAFSGVANVGAGRLCLRSQAITSLMSEVPGLAEDIDRLPPAIHLMS
ncbi:MAG: hypothetical protein JWN57_1263 [Frankiales bacterium]|jgi:hypothetical protein|nr:hypothetical protein [Frankiales bacterium]